MRGAIHENRSTSNSRISSLRELRLSLLSVLEEPKVTVCGGVNDLFSDHVVPEIDKRRRYVPGLEGFELVNSLRPRLICQRKSNFLRWSLGDEEGLTLHEGDSVKVRAVHLNLLHVQGQRIKSSAAKLIALC